MKKIHLYIISEFLKFFTLTISILSILFTINVTFYISDFLISKKINFFNVFKIFIFNIPSSLIFSIPMSVFFGILLTYRRLSVDNEIIAMKSSGINYKTLTIPIISTTCIISLFLVFFNNILLPNINHNQKIIFENIISKKPLINFNEKSITKLGEYNIYINKIDNKKNCVTGINIYKFDDINKYILHIIGISSKIKTYKNGIKFILNNGSLEKFDTNNITNNIIHANFKDYSIFIPIPNAINKQLKTTTSEIKTSTLIKYINKYKKNKKKTIDYKRDLYLRFVFAFSPIFFSSICIPLGIIFNKNNLCFGCSLAIIFIYYLMFIIVTKISTINHDMLKFIIWFPNFIIFVLGIYLFKKMVKK
jgi:lipopolysaccharide export LptBFGC system permease protein LptF